MQSVFVKFQVVGKLLLQLNFSVNAKGFSLECTQDFCMRVCCYRCNCNIAK